MIPRVLAAIVLSIGPAVAEDKATISIASPFITDRGDLRARITNNSKTAIQIHPSGCGVEVHAGEATTTISAKDPQIISLIPIKIPTGEAKDFSFHLIPGLTELEGRLRLYVHAVTNDPVKWKTVWSERFEIRNVETKAGATKPE